mgnify:CR=1 FL=1
MFKRAFKYLSVKFSTLGPLGHIPFAPGTWGSVFALLISPWLFMPFSLPVRLLLLITIFVLGAVGAGHAEMLFDQKDPGCVIIDELLGQWVVLLAFNALNFWQLLLGLVFFRIFDIFKPWPVRASETWLPKGWGVMLDDVFAGLYAALALGIIIIAYNNFK